MKYAADFRELARNALRGKWGMAVIAGLIAGLLGAAGSGGPKLNINLDNGNISANLQIAGQSIISTSGRESWGIFAGVATYLLIAAITAGIVLFILGSIVEVGYSRFNLNLADQQRELEIGTLFDYVSFWKSAVCARLLRGIYVLLWSLLFIIPGIIASYSYAMTGYILAENPDLSASEAIEQSKSMMAGNGRVLP